MTIAMTYETVLADPSATYWLKGAIKNTITFEGLTNTEARALARQSHRDPVDLARDQEILRNLIRENHTRHPLGSDRWAD